MIQAHLADGRVLNFPEGTDPEVVQATVKKMIQNPMAGLTDEELAQQQRAPATARDIFLGGVAAPLTGGIKTLTDLFGTDNVVSQKLGELSEAAQKAQTPERIAEKVRREELKRRAAEKGTMEEIKAYAGQFGEAPVEELLGGLFGGAPVIAASLLPGGQAAAGATAAARTAAIARKFAPDITGALMGLGGQKGQDYEAVKQALMERGESPEEAERKAREASSYSLENTPRQIAAAIAGAAEGRFGIERTIGDALVKKNVSQGIKGLTKPASWSQAIGSSIIGEAAPEALQGLVGTVGTNIALQQAGIPIEISQGVAGTVAHDALLGAVLGVGVSPLQKANLTREYLMGHQEKQREEAEKLQAKIEKEQAEIEKKEEEQRGLRQKMGIDMLRLPAPEKQKTEDELLQDPIGRISRDELGTAIKDQEGKPLSDVVNYIDKYRRLNGLPRLESFSVEDIRDAMTDVNPEGEQGAMDSILAYKTGFTGEFDYDRKQIEQAASQANIATGTQGFKDFMARVTGGKQDIDQMSAAERYSVFKALSDLGERTGPETVLPEGSNATRFKQKQYEAAVKAINENQTAFGRGQIIQDIKKATKLTNDRDAEAILNAAIRNGDVTENKKTVYRTYDPNTGDLKFTYPTLNQAKNAAAKQGYEVKEESLSEIGPKQAPQAKREELPSGYQITEAEVKGSEQIAENGIYVEGAGKPLVTVDPEENAEEKLARLTENRKKLADSKQLEIDALQSKVQNLKDELEEMEASGKAGTEEYNRKKSQYSASRNEYDVNSQTMLDEKAELEKPLIIKPTGKKTTTRKVFNVVKDGQVVGSFPRSENKETAREQRTQVVENVLSGLSDAELQEFTKKGGNIGKRAQSILDKRRSPEGIKVKHDFEGKVKALDEKLRQMLDKFGLKDVRLKIVRAVANGNADGEFSGVDKLIQIAFNAEKAIETLRHEALHALKNLGFFTPQQWKALEERAKSEWVDKYLKNVNVEVDGKVMSRYDAYANGVKDENGKYIVEPLTPEAILEEAIADAFADYAVGTKPPAGLIQALFNKLQQFFKALRSALTGAGFESAEEIFGKIEAGELVQQVDPDSFKSTKADLKKADKYFEENGIMPYTSEGQIEVPLDVEGKKFSIKKPYDQKKMAKDETLKNDPLTGLPMNADGTVTLYFPTTNEGARELARTRKLKASNPEANRIYLTNQSSANIVTDNPGLIDQPLGNANVMLTVDPSLLHVLEEYPDGRKDFFIPIAEGKNFAQRMTKLFTLDAPRTKGLHPDRTLSDVTSSITSAVANWQNANAKERRKMAADAKATLRNEHNIEKLFGANSKLEKTNIGDYGLTYKGKKVMSTGLGFASAQKINDEQRATTCPQSAICESLCLGETSGQNLLYGGDGQFRSGPRLSQFLKTEALVVNPEAFAISLIRQIEAFRKAAKALDYQPAIRLNVTSDFNPKMFEAVINMFPDVMFYDYTKLDTKPIAPNHHLTYSSTGASQVVDGKVVYNQYSNWDRMVDKILSGGKNVAMAFTSRNAMPKFVQDERTGKTFEVWNGDEYDARFLDPVREDGVGLIIGLTNKDNTTKPEEAAKKHNGFFLDYDPKRDGDTLVIRDQNKLAGNPEKKTFPITPVNKFSLKAIPFDPESLPKTDRDHVLPEGTILYHGAYRSVADAIKSANYLMSRPAMKSHGGTIDEGGLVWFGSEELAQNYADSKADPISVKYDRESGIIREPGQVFQAITDKPYKLISRNKVLSKTEAKNLNEALGLPDYKRLDAGDDAELAASRAHNYKNSNVDRYKINARGREQEISAPWPIILKTLNADGFYYGKTVALTAENGIRLSEDGEPMKRFSLRKAPDTPEFKQFFGKSKVVDKEDKPKVMYHGLAKDTTDFTRKTARGAPIFLTDDPKFAERFAYDSYETIAKNPEGFLNDQQIADGRKKAIAAIRKDYGKDALGREMISSIESGNPTVEAKEYLKKQFIDMLPVGPHVMELWVRAENPFDYENPRHISRIKEEVELDEDDLLWLKNGNWETIEQESVQEAIKMAGFDSFYVKEHGRKNLAVYEPNQVKSATGNIGTFSRESSDVRYSLRNVAFPSVKEAQEAADDTPVPDTVEFKHYMDGNQWVDKDGKAKKFFHATVGNFFDFEASPIYLSETAKDSEKFGREKESGLRALVYRALNKDEKLPLFQAAVDKAVESGKITAERGKKFMRDAKRSIPDFDRYPSIKEEMDAELINLSSQRMNIIPLYARAMNPFDFRNPEHVALLAANVRRGDLKISEEAKKMAREMNAPSEYPDHWYRSLPGRLKEGFTKTIEDKRVQDAIRALNFDGFISRKSREAPLTYAVYDPSQVKSVTANNGEFNLIKSDIRYSLQKVSKPEKKLSLGKLSEGETKILNSITSKRDKNWVQRLLDSLSGYDVDYFRQKALNRYNSLSKLDRMVVEATGKQMLADSSAEAMALMSDLSAGVTASVLGFQDRHGGVPVFRNGVTTVDRSKKGLIAILKPLAEMDDPALAYQSLQFIMAVKRGTRFDRENRKESGITEAERNLAKKMIADNPILQTVADEYVEFNNSIVKYLVDTGVLSKERGAEYIKYADYVPFYRQVDGENTIGPNLFQSIGGVKPPKKAKGGSLKDAPLADFLETVVRNTQSSINMGMKNVAAQTAAKNAVFVEMAERVQKDGKDVIQTGPEYFQVWENGKQVSYRTHDMLLIDSLSSLNMPDIPGLSFFSAPANLLRNLVTKDPAFMMANLMRDSLSSWVTSGVKMTPVVGTMTSFTKILAGKSPAFQALLDAGVIGGYEFSANVEQTGDKIYADLQRKYGKKTTGEKALKSVDSVWQALEKGTTASDAATRVLVYEQVLAETGSEAEALFRAGEVLNFNRKGNSPLVRIVTAAFPFLNARMQGLDLFYRAGIAPTWRQIAHGITPSEAEKNVQKAFFVRGALLAGLSLMYYAMVHDDDEWKKQEQETKDGYWIIPQLGVKIPIPFEVGVLFKVMPERIAALTLGNDTGEDFAKSIKHNLWNTFGLVPIPQVARPLVEVATNYNFFTGREIIGQGMEGTDSIYQVGPGTTKFSEALGGALGISPIKLDHVIKGYTGTIGMYVLDAVDAVASSMSDTPKASKRFEQLPILRRFLVDPEARGNVTAYYDLKAASDQFVQTANMLRESGKADEYAKYVEEHQGLLATRQTVLNLEKRMKNYREMRQKVQGAQIDADEKRDLLTTIGQAENAITENIQDIKQIIASMK